MAESRSLELGVHTTDERAQDVAVTQQQQREYSSKSQQTNDVESGISSPHTDEYDEEQVTPPSPRVDLKIPCYLENTWNIYFDGAHSKNASYEAFQNSLVSIAQFSTVQQFWLAWGELPLDSLPRYCNLRFFKFGIEPSWEDPQNCNGGKWSLFHTPQDRAMIWREIVIALIGEQFFNSEDLCGVVLSIRSRGDSVHLWNKSLLSSQEINAISQQIRQILSLSDSFPIEYQRHRESISQYEDVNKRKRMMGAHSPKSRKSPTSPRSPLSATTCSSSVDSNADLSPGHRKNGKSNNRRRPNSRQASLDVDNNFDSMNNDMSVSHAEPIRNELSDAVVVMSLPTTPVKLESHLQITPSSAPQPHHHHHHHQQQQQQRRNHSKRQQPPISPSENQQNAQTNVNVEQEEFVQIKDRHQVFQLQIPTLPEQQQKQEQEQELPQQPEPTPPQNSENLEADKKPSTDIETPSAIPPDDLPLDSPQPTTTPAAELPLPPDPILLCSSSSDISLNCTIPTSSAPPPEPPAPITTTTFNNVDSSCQNDQVLQQDCPKSEKPPTSTEATASCPAPPTPKKKRRKAATSKHKSNAVLKTTPTPEIASPLTNKFSSTKFGLLHFAVVAIAVFVVVFFIFH